MSHGGVRRSLIVAWVADGGLVDPDVDAFLRRLAVDLHVLAGRRIAVFAGPGLEGLPRLIVDRWTDAHVIQIGGITPASDDASVDVSSTRITYPAATSVAERHALLTVEGPFDALIDLAHDDVDPQLARLRKTLFHVRRHGFYIARTDVDPSGGQPFADAIARMLTVGARLVRGRRRPCAVTTLPM